MPSGGVVLHLAIIGDVEDSVALAKDLIARGTIMGRHPIIEQQAASGMYVVSAGATAPPLPPNGHASPARS